MFLLFQRSLESSEDPESWEEWADDQQELDEILYGYGFSYSHRRTLSLLFCYPNVGFAEDAPFFLKLRDMFGKDKVQLYKDGVGLSGLVCVCLTRACFNFHIELDMDSSFCHALELRAFVL